MGKATMKMILKRSAALGVASVLVCVLASCGMKEESAPDSTKAVPPTPVFQPGKPEKKEPFEKYSEKMASATKGDGKTIKRGPASANGDHAADATADYKYEKAEISRKKNGGHETATRGPASANGDPKPEAAADYRVKLAADPVLTIPGPPGQLIVWIGLPAYEPAYSDLKTKIDTLPATGKTAKVTPFAPGFKVEPATSICMKTNPRGSDVRFKLIPLESGSFKVGADVALFESDDCSGAPIPKATTTLRVDVSVDRVKLTLKYLSELWDVFWKKLLQFWGEALALFFAALLFVFRNKLKKWMGYSE
jgi:hypothetical protein